MSMTITDPVTGQPVVVFASDGGGFIDLALRADTKTAWETQALAYGLLVNDGTGKLRPSPGVSIDILGKITLADPASTMANPLPPLVRDARYHVNVRMAADLPWQAMCLRWMKSGVVDVKTDGTEDAQVLLGVSLIDPDTLLTPSRVWL